MKAEEALDVRQVAELLEVSDKHIYELAAQGKLPAFRIGKAVRFDPQDVADWLRKREPSNKRQGVTEPQKPRNSKPNRSGEQSIAPAHIWRHRISSLEVALSDSSSMDWPLQLGGGAGGSVEGDGARADAEAEPGAGNPDKSIGPPEIREIPLIFGVWLRARNGTNALN